MEPYVNCPKCSHRILKKEIDDHLLAHEFAINANEELKRPEQEESQNLKSTVEISINAILKKEEDLKRRLNLQMAQ